MGADIHLFVEKKVDGKWTYLAGSDFYDERNYDMFAMLANVRNGSGFAGIKTGEGFKPISMPKGLPLDCCDIIKGESDGWGIDGHSHSYLTVKELLDYDWMQTTYKRGMVSAAEYARLRWEKKTNPDAQPRTWSGWVSGSSITHVSVAEMETKVYGIVKDKEVNDDVLNMIAETLGGVYCDMEWQIKYADRASYFLGTVLPKLREFSGGDYESVRIVFWFDN